MNTNESIMGAFTLGYYYALRTERKFKQCRATFQQLEDFARAVKAAQIAIEEWEKENEESDSDSRESAERKFGISETKD